MRVHIGHIGAPGNVDVAYTVGKRVKTADILAKLHDDFEGDLRCAGNEKPLNSWYGDSRSRRGSAAGRRRRQAASAVGEK